MNGTDLEASLEPEGVSEGERAGAAEGDESSVGFLGAGVSECF